MSTKEYIVNHKNLYLRVNNGLKKFSVGDRVELGFSAAKTLLASKKIAEIDEKKKAVISEKPKAEAKQGNK